MGVLEGVGECFVEGLDHWKAETNVGHEIAVHDVKMKPIGTKSDHFGGLCSELRKIRRQNGRRDDCLKTKNEKIKNAKYI